MPLLMWKQYTLMYMSNSYICTPTHQQISSWKGQLLQVPQGAYQWWPLLVCSHRQGGQSSPETVLLLEETEEVWHGVSHPHKLLQMHDREHSDWLHHSVVRELHSQVPQSPTQCGQVCRVHHRQGAPSPAGHLPHTMPQKKLAGS